MWVKVGVRKTVVVPRSEAKRPERAAAKPAPVRELPSQAQGERKLKGERSGEFQALAARGSNLYETNARDAVDALCERYGITCHGRGEQRMLVTLATLDQALQAGDETRELTVALAQHDTRRSIFQLEALLRLYSKEHEELEPALAKIKELEDALGAASIPANAIEAATELGVPQPVIDALKQEQSDALKKVTTLLERDWAPGPDGRSDAVKKMLKSVDKADFGSDSHDRKFVAKALSKHVEHIRDEHYSMKVLDDGVHALRRQLRWTTLYTEALDGTVQIGPVKHDESAYVKVLGHKDLEKQYQMRELPAPPDGERPITLPAELYAGLQKTIYDLGVIKDDVELRESLEKAFKAAGLPKHRVDDFLGERGTQKDMEKRATVVHEQMKHEHLLKRVHHAFEDA